MTLKIINSISHPGTNELRSVFKRQFFTINVAVYEYYIVITTWIHLLQEL